MNETKVVKISDIDLSDTTFQSRLDFDSLEIRRLASDIEANNLRNPIGLWRRKDSLVVLYGFQRIRAFQLLQRNTIPARVYEDISLREAYLQNFSDNIQHEDLSDLEMALRLEFFRDKLGYPIADLANLLGRKETTVYNLLRFCLLRTATLRSGLNSSLRKVSNFTSPVATSRWTTSYRSS